MSVYTVLSCAFCGAHGGGVAEPIPTPTLTLEVGEKRYAVEVKAV